MSDTKTNRAQHLRNVANKINEFGHDFHLDGTVPNIVIDKFVELLIPMQITNSMETGCGRTTLLLSNASAHHTVFSLDVGESQTRVKNSPILNAESAEFVDGPSQKNVPAYQFQRLQFALIDGPHAYPFPELEYFYVYPHIDAGGILVVDDVCIPTIRRMYEVLKEDPMWQLDSVVINTAFFRRTDAPTFDPFGEGWEAQPFNGRRFKGSEPKSYAVRRFLYGLSPGFIRNFYGKLKGR